MVSAEQQVDQKDSAVKSTAKTGIYEMDKPFVSVQIKIGSSKHPYTHVLRKPTFDEEEARERKMPLITSDLGKIDGADATTMSLDDESANVYLYDKIIRGVKGYAIGGEKPNGDEVSADKTVQTPNGDVAIKDLVPANHKSTAITGLYPSSFKVDLGEDTDEEDSDFTFSLGGGREWTIKQEIGGRIKQEDGSLSNADFTIRYTFREPTESERKKFRTEAIKAINLRDAKTGAFTERRSTNLKSIRDLFNSMIVSIEGASIAGGDIVVSNKEHLAQIPSDFKKGCVLRLFNFLETDLGN